MGQAFPIGLVTVALPALFRKNGLPLELFWVFAIPLIPGWLRWAVALVVDNKGIHSLGFRKSWIAPCTVLGALSYLWISQLNPVPEYLWLILTLLTFKSIIMTAQDVAVDGWVVESFEDHERAMGASIVVFLSFLGTVTAQGLVASVGSLGWTVAMSMAAVLIVAVALPAMVYPEPPQPREAQQRRNTKQSANVLAFVRKANVPKILAFLIIAGFGSNLIRAMLPVFLVDIGLTLLEIGLVFSAGTLFGVSGAAILTPRITRSWGLQRAVIFTLSNYPVCCALFFWMSQQTLITTTFITVILVYSMWVSTMMWMLVTNARIKWSSKSQAATDFSIMASVSNFGEWLGATAAGLAAATIGWTWFYVTGWGISAVSALMFVSLLDRSSLPAKYSD